MYFNHSKKEQWASSSIAAHYEDDRFENVFHASFTSKHPAFKTFLSINQSNLHGTSEVDVPSEDQDVIDFDS